MATVPDRLRGPIATELRSLVRGDRPELLTWVREYGEHGATLIDQPDAVWTHPDTQVTETSIGGWLVIVPLWTIDEAPSDLSAELEVASDGTATITDVRVL